MKIVVCLETLPDPDCIILKNGEFDFENCRVRLDSFSAGALEFALSLKDRYGVQLEAVLLDSFEIKHVYEDIKALGCDKVKWIKAHFTFDPFKRAELFAEAIECGSDDIVIAGYHCETCCTNSIPMLIALNKSLPYQPEVSAITVNDSAYILRTFKTEKEIEHERSCVVVSVRTSRKLRYPSLKERLRCRENDDQTRDEKESTAVHSIDGSQCLSAEYVSNKISVSVAEKAESHTAAAGLINSMNENGMFQI